MQERLQKIIAAAGVASRRKAEELILHGRVTVNGRVVAELGSKGDPARDLIGVDGKVIWEGNAQDRIKEIEELIKKELDKIKKEDLERWKKEDEK